MSDFEEPFHEEEEPESLKRKWDEDAFHEAVKTKCPHCGQLVDDDCLLCLFCGERVFQQSGLLGRMLGWIQQGHVIWILLTLILVFMLVALAI